MYIYESHFGDLYATNKEIDWEDLYCEVCGDMDWPIGYASTRAEAWELLEDKTDMFDESLCEGCPHDFDDDYCYYVCENYARSGAWSYDYVQKFLNENWSE
jgi:hypothetical protein